MNKDYKKQNKFNAFLSSKGFYVALAVCLMASGVASWIVVNHSVNEIDDKIIPPSSSQTQVNRPQSDVEKPKPEKPSSAPSETPKEEKPKPAEETKAQFFQLPAPGDIFNTYSGGELVKSKTMGDWRTHDGVDINCEQDRNVKSAGAGTVTDISKNPLWGTCITITHDGGITTHYYSLSENTDVSKAQIVAGGDVIGTASDSASVEVLEPIHVHFAAKKDGQWIDPTTLISSVKK